MNTEEILETIRAMAAEGKVKEAEEYAVAHFTSLSEDVQGDVLTRLLASAQPSDVRAAAHDVQDAALDALDEITELETELQKEA